MKKIVSVIFMVCLLISFSLSAQATAPRLTDDAGLLSQEEAVDLEAMLDEISIRQGMDIVVVTVDSTDGASPMAYADDWFDYNDYSEDGILLLVSMEDRDWWVSTAGYGITAITDAGLEYISDEFLFYLSSDLYYDAFETFARLCDEFITQAKTGAPYDGDNMPKEPFSVGFTLLFCIGFGFIVALIATSIMKGQRKSVRQQVKADSYVIPGSLQLTGSRDLYLYSQVTKTERPQSNGSSTHSSSSGRSHGGGGGKF